ncbi:hypothetical protein [Rhodophyticola porphyridii]|uniref:Uncharacterized protein n=1 Tax=Rhodophyticola porphyridii TaxID=1852017 RepID=A0A3L9Y7M3_9RHOB|nr:hypothetical protein [Rhodophyticola porphyridii]RMA43288.1 hypothetical protein D9R08_06655 [Rhodophyticola porphyridii]
MATGTPHYAAKVIPSAYDFELATKLFPWAFLVYVALGIVGALLRFWSALWPRITAFFRRDGGKS